jgi:hypothetical protein
MMIRTIQRSRRRAALLAVLALRSFQATAHVGGATLPEVRIDASPEREREVSATRADAPLVETPPSVSVVTRDQTVRTEPCTLERLVVLRGPAGMLSSARRNVVASATYRF